MADGPWTKYRQQQQQQPRPQQPTVKQPPSQRDIERETGSFTSRSAGLFQGGVLNPIEGIGQLVEHMTGQKLAPDYIREKLKSFRSYARSSRTGRIAEAAGEIGSTMLVPESRLGTVARGALSAAVQPVENSKDYWFDKAAQTGLGAAGSALVGSPVAQRMAAHGALAALAPHQYWLHWPLYHLAREASRYIPTGGPAIQRAAGAFGGTLAGRGLGDDDTPPPAAPSPPRASPSPAFTDRFTGDDQNGTR